MGVMKIMIDGGVNYRLRDRRIVLGITGSIAAYKAAEIARLLVKAGSKVQVVMTPSANEFIGKQTLQAITGNIVRDNIFDAEHESAMGHIELARWAEMILIAPSTANFIAKLAHGSADTLLNALCIASESTIAIAPAMNEKMWKNTATQLNIEILKKRGMKFFGPAAGLQACGDTGLGRMVEPKNILSKIIETFGTGSFVGKKVLITAGPTREPIDIARYLSNRSSGKMGYSLAKAFSQEGADTTLISGPVALEEPIGVKRINVETAKQMLFAVEKELLNTDLFISCAAVSDYRPSFYSDKKLKKESENITMNLVKNPDILSEVSKKNRDIFCVGFAAESENLEKYAKEKLVQKKIDMIAGNIIGNNLAFDAENNSLLVIWSDGKSFLPEQPKSSLSEKLVSLIAERMNAKNTIKDT